MLRVRVGAADGMTMRYVISLSPDIHRSPIIGRLQRTPAPADGRPPRRDRLAQLFDNEFWDFVWVLEFPASTDHPRCWVDAPTFVFIDLSDCKHSLDVDVKTHNIDKLTFIVSI